MYKHILIPIDDSKLSTVAVKNGIEFARSIRARVTACIKSCDPPSDRLGTVMIAMA